MAALTGRYLSLTSAQLATLRTQLETARTAILTGGQTWSRPGMSMGRVSFMDVTADLAEVSYAEAIVNRTWINITHADLR